MDDDVLAHIPGELLGAAGQSLPAAVSSSETTQTMTVCLPDGARAEVTFIKLLQKVGKTARRAGFWTPQSAVILEEKSE